MASPESSMKIPVIIIPRTHGWNVFRAVQRFADFSSQLNELWLLQHRRNFAKTTLAVVVPIAPVTRSVHRAVRRRTSVSAWPARDTTASCAVLRIGSSGASSRGKTSSACKDVTVVDEIRAVFPDKQNQTSVYVKEIVKRAARCARTTSSFHDLRARTANYIRQSYREKSFELYNM